MNTGTTQPVPLWLLSHYCVSLKDLFTSVLTESEGKPACLLPLFPFDSMLVSRHQTGIWGQTKH